MTAHRSFQYVQSNQAQNTKIMADRKNGSAYGAPAGDTDFRKTYDLDEYAAKAKEREDREKEERKARYEAKMVGKKYHKPMTGDETYTSARENVFDFSSMVGKTQIVPAGAGVGKRGRSAGFYCEACDLTFKDNLQLIEHRNSMQHLLNTGQTAEVKRATAEEVHERIAHFVKLREDLAKEKATSLEERLENNRAEEEKEREAKREKRREEAEKKRTKKQEAESGKMDYGEDVRIEGEHDEDDMMAAMGISGFGTSKK